MLTKEEINILIAFMAGFDSLTGAWREIERVMIEEFGIDQPEEALEELLIKLQNAS